MPAIFHPEINKTLVMGLGQNFLTRLGSGQPSLVWGLGLKKTSNFSIFSPLDQKNLFGLGQKVPGSKAGQPLIYCGSK